RPDDIDWYDMQAPAWMLDRGWAVTAEVGGVTAHDRAGPETAPAIAWLKRGEQETTVVLGGRHLGGPPATVNVTLNGTAVASYPLTPGFFLRRLTLPAGALSNAGAYTPLEIRATPGTAASDLHDGGGRICLEQFDAQSPGTPM